MTRFSLAVLAVALAVAVAASAQDYDLLIRNGRVVDGTGAPWRRADVAVRGDAIVAVAPRIAGTARRVVDAGDKVVAPGFIDLHTHARRGIFEIPTAENYVRQGVTTLVEGPDGSSPLPLGPFLDKLEALGPGVNFASLVGHGSIREAVIGRANRAPSAEELARMQDLVRQAMREGAFGLSTGLFYVPGSFARTEEVVALARVAGELGGIHVSHMRDEAGGVLASVRETIAIGEEGHLPTQVTHHKMIGRAAWGQSAESLGLVRDARARGVDVTLDAYPYTASSTALQAALLPAWALEGGAEALLRRIADPAVRSRILEVVKDKIRNERGGGDPRNIAIAACGFDRTLEGQTLADILRGRGLAPTVENAALLALEIVERGGASAVFHAISEEDVERILASPFTMVASDGEIPAFGQGAPHPRSYGTFARVLAVYVREKGRLTLEDAIRKMSSMPAARLGLGDRGLVRPGMKADLVVLDPDTIRDRATFEKPHQYAEGVSLVVVNGEIVLDGERMTGLRPGRVLRGPAYPRPAAAQDYDLLIRGGRIVDGTGAPWRRADVAVRGDTIVAVGSRLEGAARRVVDAGDRIVAPGFIDIHAHAWPWILNAPAAENYVRQGVTTLVDGPDGESPLPLGDALAKVDALPPGVNYASLVGHGSIRGSVLGNENRAPTPAELARMQQLVGEAMRDGAFGLSTGLIYAPGTFARTDEVVALARVAGELGGIHVSHMRDEAGAVLDSVKETIAIGEEGRLPTQVTHHKLVGRPVWGRSVDSLRLVQEARKRGVDVTLDQYPYTASSNSLSNPLFPPWALGGGDDALRQRLAEPTQRESIRVAVRDRLQNAQGGGDPRNVLITACAFDRKLEGQTLADILLSRGLQPTVENAAPLVLEITERGGAGAIFHAIAEEDVERILVFPFTMVASDGVIQVPGPGRPHPRSFGTFVRVLAVYVREKGLLTLEDAIRKMSSMPAARLGLGDRGLLRPGMKADLVVLDPATVRDLATFEKPQYAEGVSLVVVNGQIVLDGERMTGVRPGRVLRGPAF